MSSALLMTISSVSSKSTSSGISSAGISVQALYQARKRLRARGLLAPGRARREAPRFSKVAVAATPVVEAPRFRIELPNGAVLGWSGAASVGPVADLLERMARLP